MKTILLLAAFCVIGKCYAAPQQARVGEQSALACNMGRLFRAQQLQNHESPPRLNQGDQMLMSAQTVFVAVQRPYAADSSTRAEQALKKALRKWGRFQVVDDASTADLIITITDYSSSKRMMMERLKVNMAVFAGEKVSSENPMPLWSVEETGPAFGNKRPTAKLVEHLKKDLIELERSLRTTNSSAKTRLNQNSALSGQIGSRTE